MDLCRRQQVSEGGEFKATCIKRAFIINHRGWGEWYSSKESAFGYASPTTM